jgi:hypothetical protein
LAQTCCPRATPGGNRLALFLLDPTQRKTETLGAIRRQFVVILGTGILLCWNATGATAALTVSELLEHGERYHQQAVSITGKASGLKILTGPRNLPFYTFSLGDDTAHNDDLTVIMQGKPAIANGDHVYVYGLFFKSRKAGRTTITNRIEATIVVQLHDQHQPLIG